MVYMQKLDGESRYRQSARVGLFVRIALRLVDGAMGGKGGLLPEKRAEQIKVVKATWPGAWLIGAMQESLPARIYSDSVGLGDFSS